MRLTLPILLLASCGGSSPLLECSDLDLDALTPYAGCSATIAVENNYVGAWTVELAYDDQGQLLTDVRTNEEGVFHDVTNTYDANLLLVARSEDGFESTYAYNALGTRTGRTTTAPDGTQETYVAETSDSSCEIRHWTISRVGRLYQEQTNRYDAQERFVGYWNLTHEPQRYYLQHRDMELDEDGNVVRSTARTWLDKAPGDREPRSEDVSLYNRDEEGRLLDLRIYDADRLDAEPWVHDHREYDENGDEVLFERRLASEEGVDFRRTVERADRRPLTVTTESDTDGSHMVATYTWSCPD